MAPAAPTSAGDAMTARAEGGTGEPTPSPSQRGTHRSSSGTTSTNHNRSSNASHGSALFLSTVEDSEDFSMDDLRASQSGLGYSDSKRLSGDIEPLAEIETRAVSCLRIVVMSVLVIAGTLVSVIVFLVASGSEKDDFKRQYNTHAHQILEAFNGNVNLKLDALESLAVSASSYASTRKETMPANASLPYHEGDWPFVTVPDFAARAQATRDLGQALYLGILPLVTVANRRAWEEYSLAHGNDWITESLAYEQQIEELYGSNAETAATNDNDETHSNRGRNVRSRRMRLGQKSRGEGPREAKQQHAAKTPHSPDHKLKQWHEMAPDSRSMQQQQQTQDAEDVPIPRYPDYLYERPATPEQIMGNIPDFSAGFSRQIFQVPTFYFPDGTNLTVPQVQFKHEVPYYFPGWQHSKVIRDFINFDLFEYDAFNDSIIATTDSKQATLSRVTDLGVSNQGNPFAATLAKAWKKEAGVHAGDPYSIITFPVFENALAPPTAADNKIVGVIVVVMFWTSFLDNVLSSDAKGLVVIIQNACGQQYTYKVTGADSIFLGEGDRHDNDFADMRKSIAVKSTRNGVILNKEFCPYTISVYPSKETKEFYITNAPIYYTLACACVFVFAIVVFLVYDCIVERRQKLVLKTAIQNRAIVSSLFPPAIRDRLLNQDQNSGGKNNGRQNKRNNGGRNNDDDDDDVALHSASGNSGNMKNGDFGPDYENDLGPEYECIEGEGLDEVHELSGMTFEEDGDRPANRMTDTAISASSAYADGTTQAEKQASSQRRNSGASSLYKESGSGASVSTSTHGGATKSKIGSSAFRAGDNRPIADIYPHTTVFFADIAGFTRWSSQREPTEVFELLQTLYATFDKVAKRLKVFKIETIGDCYVAVTGLPNPQEDHAVIMARFARECVHRMFGLVHGLADVLGKDTAKLALRVGMHSGSVTAGVLRGEKSRFQLFGDTVNTASRMESTGEPNHVQCSETTARLLEEADKGFWLKARDEKVFAKGKGEMQTYWIKNRSRRRNNSGGASRSVGSESASLAPSERSLGSMKSLDLPMTKLTRGESGESSIGSTGSSETNNFDSIPLRVTSIPAEKQLSAGSLSSTYRNDSVASLKPSEYPPYAFKDGEQSSDGQNQPQERAQVHQQETTSMQTQHQPTTPATVPMYQNRVPSTVSASSTDKRDQYIQWASDTLAKLLKHVVVHRKTNEGATEDPPSDGLPAWEGSPCLVVEEVVEVIDLRLAGANEEEKKAAPATKTDHPSSPNAAVPDTAIGQAGAAVDVGGGGGVNTVDDLLDMDALLDVMVESIELKDAVMMQLADYVTKVASMYRDNPFHCFEHACHVAMSTTKLMTQLKQHQRQNKPHYQPPAYLKRISSNPLCHFAVFFAAIVHDVDHTGISNIDLIRNRDEMAELYENRSVAEQNSMDIAWELLMDGAYADLRQCIYQTEEELKLFRHLLVNCVIATDIFDKDAKAFREKRWGRAFGPMKMQAQEELSTEEFECLQATVMLEHTIQASDVIHTMQHYTIFRKWNERLFEEMLQAYEARLSSKDPTGGWFESEVMFFDFYVIPLAKKLLESGAFGSSSDEFLQYALENRALWAVKGSDVVREMASKYHRGKILSTLLEGNRKGLPVGDEDDFTAGQSHASSKAA